MEFDPDKDPGPVPSPCRSICILEPGTKLCSACQRTLDEIIAWQSASQDDKRKIWTLINARRKTAS